VVEVFWVLGEHAADGTANVAVFAVKKTEMGILEGLQSFAHGLGIIFKCKETSPPDEMWIVLMGDRLYSSSNPLLKIFRGMGYVTGL
jgi:hypothetical protein